jgi:uncharacterized protein
MIDVNISLSRWPFRQLPDETFAQLTANLAAHRIDQAWAGSFEAVLQRDLRAVNARLAAACHQQAPLKLCPFGTVNPLLPDWREDLRICREEHRMLGIRLFPAYHGYDLREPVFAELLSLASRSDLLVQIVVRLEDPRTQHPLLRVPDVEVSPLADLVGQRPRLRVVLLNALATIGAATVQRLVETERVYFDLSMLEGMAGVQQWISRFSSDWLLFGSHYPFFVLESALLKLQESELTAQQRAAIGRGNAERCIQTEWPGQRRTGSLQPSHPPRES